MGGSQVNDLSDGCKARQISTTAQESKRRIKDGVLSRDESSISDPDRSKPRSNTVLRSPQLTTSKTWDWSVAGFRWEGKETRDIEGHISKKKKNSAGSGH